MTESRLKLRLSVFWLLLITLAIPLEPAWAQDRRGLEVSPVLRQAATLFEPLQIDALMSVTHLGEVLTRQQQPKWLLPSATAWPVVEGRPHVETPQAAELSHVVQRGEHLARLREMYRISRSALEAWNPSVDLKALEEGQEIVVWKRAPQSFSQSVGRAHRGYLRNGEPLPLDDHYVVLYPHRTFGTFYTVSEIVRVMHKDGELYPTAHPLVIGDISFRNGRRIRPHRSHRTGRDVDISYPQLTPPPNYQRFHRTRRRNLDAKRMLDMIRTFVAGGHVEYIFMDRNLQREVYQQAKLEGAPPEWLEAVFQYPHWRGGDALIRHARGHRNHFHIRFQCQPTDRRCS